VAERLVAALELPQGLVRQIAVAGPGFINFVLAEEQLASAVAAVLAAGERYGRSDGGGRAGQPVNVEFVSANPTGPLHVGHGRQAALGDAIAAVLEWTGWRVTREFYYNDGGAQIANLARSVQARIRELRGQLAGLQDGALWLKTTDFGDDKDRVMRKRVEKGGDYTYFLPDVAYHVDKWERGFSRAINVQGADHHSTVTRVRIGLQALGMGIPTGYPEYVLHQMVTVMKGGEEMRLS